jgi:hypothetical protein
MVTLIAQYLLIGVAVGFTLELVIRWSGQDVTYLERVQMIVGWPIMAIIFIHNFFKGMFDE